MKLEPNWAQPPGSTISRLMSAREIASEELADGLGLNRDEFASLIDGRARISQQIAAALEDQLGSSARFWLARDKAYVEDLARLKGSQEFDPASWSRAMPVRSMKQYGWIPKEARGGRLFHEILEFFGCESLSDWRARYSSGIGTVAFRASFAFEVDSMATLVWLRVGEHQASKLSLGSFEKSKFEQLLPRLKRLSALKHPRKFLPKLQAACRDVGVAVTTARAPAGCRASGASWIMTNGNPIIHLSFRHRSDDHFWFTFFHEAAHVLLHGGDHIDLDEADAAPIGGQDEEAEANAFAEDILLPRHLRRGLFESTPTPKEIVSVARSAKVAAGILVGQLEKAGIVPHGRLSFMKHRYRWQEDPYVPELS